MTHKDMEKLGWETIAVDTNSFVSKTTTINIWLEMFYCREKDTVHLMLVKKGEKGEIVRETISNEKCENPSYLNNIYT